MIEAALFVGGVIFIIVLAVAALIYSFDKLGFFDVDD